MSHNRGHGDNEDCRWILTCTSRYPTITFDSFETETNFDFVNIYDGSSTAAPLHHVTKRFPGHGGSGSIPQPAPPAADARLCYVSPTATRLRTSVRGRRRRTNLALECLRAPG